MIFRGKSMEIPGFFTQNPKMGKKQAIFWQHFAARIKAEVPGRTPSNRDRSRPPPGALLRNRPQHPAIKSGGRDLRINFPGKRPAGRGSGPDFCGIRLCDFPGTPKKTAVECNFRVPRLLAHKKSTCRASGPEREGTSPLCTGGEGRRCCCCVRRSSISL